MSPEKKRRIAKALSLVVSAAGVTVMLGWVFDVGILTSISPAWTSMKLDTAFSFFVGGVSLYFMARAREGEFDKAQVVLSITSLMIGLLMGTLFFSTLLGIHTGAEDLFGRETGNMVRTLTPDGRPSRPCCVFCCSSQPALLRR